MSFLRRKLFLSMRKINFFYENIFYKKSLRIILTFLEITSDRGLVVQIFEATMNLAPIGVICIFGYDCIMGGVLS